MTPVLEGNMAQHARAFDFHCHRRGVLAGDPDPCMAEHPGDASAWMARHSSLESVTGLDLGSPMRHLVVLFTDLCSSVGLATQMDCLDYVAFLRELRNLCRSTVANHRGTIARLQGDGMLAIFGLEGPPRAGSHGAICCALELHQAVGAIAREAGVASAALHSGVHAGWTYLECGDLERGRFDVVGNVPNLAARLSGLADRNDIFATEEAIRPCLNRYCVGERRSLVVKGWSGPIAVYPVLGHAWSHTAPAPASASTGIPTRASARLSLISPRAMPPLDGASAEA
jgi:class 3 adenylate cyclase